MIIVKNRELLIPNNERYLGTTYDDNSTIRTFRIARFNEDGTDKAQLDFYLIFNYDDGYAPDASGVVKSVSDEYIVLEWDVSEAITEHAGCLFAWVRGFDYTGTIRWSSFPGVFYIEGSGTEPSNLSDLEERISEEDRLLRLAKLYKSQPMTAATVADMKDRERIYVYVGNEPGYTYGNWYFWDGSAWVPGGVYNAIAVQTDTSLTQENMAADARAVGDEFAENASAIQNLPKWMHGNLVLDEIHARDCFMQGACYIGNGRIVAYYSDANDTDTGMLRCFDLSEYALLWEYPIKGYHGNAVCYRPQDNCVYMCGAFLASDTSTLINKVVVVSLDNPSVVKQEISAPMPLYSIAYDADTDTFYSISARGTTDGDANRLYRYNGIFASVAGSVDLEKYIGVESMRSSQGASLIHNGIIYNIGYDDQARYVTGNYIDTGKIAIIAHIPDMINGYRAIGEVENIIYASDTDSFLIGASSVNSGVHEKVIEYWFEVDLYHGIYEYMAYPVPNEEGYEHNVLSNTRLVLNVANGAPSLKPCQMLGATRYKCVIDAVNMALTLGAYAYINLITQHGGVTEIGNINLSRFHGTINSATMYNVYSSGDSDVTFVKCHFTESATYDATYQANVIVSNNNKYYFDRCVFDDFEITDGVSVASHIFANASGKFTLSNCTFSGNKRRYITVFNGAVTERDTYQWERHAGTFTIVANQYVYTGLSFTVPDGMYYRVYFYTNYGSSKPTGMGLAKSDSEFSNSTIETILENDEHDEHPAKYSPEYVVEAGTYYLWVRKAGVETNSHAMLCYRADPIGT